MNSKLDFKLIWSCFTGSQVFIRGPTAGCERVGLSVRGNSKRRRFFLTFYLKHSYKLEVLKSVLQSLRQDSVVRQHNVLYIVFIYQMRFLV